MARRLFGGDLDRRGAMRVALWVKTVTGTRCEGFIVVLSVHWQNLKIPGTRLGDGWKPNSG